MLPYQNLLQLDRNAEFPIFLQMTNQLAKLIQSGQLPAGAKLPSSRAFAKLFDLNRNTVTRALEELQALGWITILPKKGAFVVESFPTLKPNKWIKKEVQPSLNKKKSFPFYDFPHLPKPAAYELLTGFDDGLPDVRLAPIEELARGYAKNLRQLAFEKNLNYNDALGNLSLREKLAASLNETRGLNITADNILITRGTMMAIHLAIAATVKTGDKVIIGATNYKTANRVIRHYGGELLRIPVDEKGIVVSAIPDLCEKHRVRAIYVTSHHHHPTTVTLSPERRMQLLELANKYQFVILEDDYDYDFHFDNSPVLPLASSDNKELVLYFGSFTKIIAPAFRVGYLVGPNRLIQSVVGLRRIFDRQGDTVLEQTFADLMANGTIRRHLKKSLRHYQQRRDICCDLLKKELGRAIHFEKPAGGMAIWATFDDKINLPILSKKMIRKGVYLADGSSYHPEGQQLNSIRMGFASMNLEEIERSVAVLKKAIS